MLYDQAELGKGRAPSSDIERSDQEFDPACAHRPEFQELHEGPMPKALTPAMYPRKSVWNLSSYGRFRKTESLASGTFAAPAFLAAVRALFVFGVFGALEVRASVLVLLLRTGRDPLVLGAALFVECPRARAASAFNSLRRFCETPRARAVSSAVAHSPVNTVAGAISSTE